MISRDFVLPAEPQDFVGEVRVEVPLENYADCIDASRGLAPATGVRETNVDLLIDTETSMLVLPRGLVEFLGLELTHRCVVEHSDGRREEADVAALVRLSASGRTAEVQGVVAPEGSEPTLGQIPLKILDLLVDCTHQLLVPRPESPFKPFSKLK
jgi:predicted aspartyl protease